MAKPVLVSNPSRIGASNDDFVFDFVFVEREFKGRSTDEEDDDDDSYDYCEDVCTILSNNNGNSDEENGDDDVTSPTTMNLKDSVLTVPSVLLKDLDEAHEAAKLTLMTDTEGANDLVTMCSDDEHVLDAEEKDSTLSSSSQQSSATEQSEKENSEESEQSQAQTLQSSMTKYNEDCTGIEDSPPLVPPDSSSLAPTDSTTEVKAMTTNTVNGKTVPMQTFIIMPAAKPESSPSSTATPCFLLTNFPQKEASTMKDEKQSSGDKKNTVSTDITSTNKKTSGPVAISRTSNKKRRKKLKLLKKAQAAEKFQQQAALLNLSSHGSKINKKFLKQSKKQQTPPRCGSKKVANIAVSCAIESMFNYRKELAVQGK